MDVDVHASRGRTLDGGLGEVLSLDASVASDHFGLAFFDDDNNNRSSTDSQGDGRGLDSSRSSPGSSGPESPLTEPTPCTPSAKPLVGKQKARCHLGASLALTGACWWCGLSGSLCLRFLPPVPVSAWVSSGQVR